MRWTRLAGLSLLGLTPILCGANGGGCATVPTHTYRIERTALVPLPAPDLNARAPGGPAELEVGDAALLWASAPTLASGSTAGLYVPRHQPTGMLRVPINRYVHLRFELELMPTSGAIAVPAGRLDPSPTMGATYGGGVGAGGYVSRRWWLSGSTDIMAAAIPSAIRTICLDCGPTGGGATVADTMDYLPVVRLQANVGYNLGPVEFSASLALRNHPLNVADTSAVSTTRPEPDAQLSAGSMMLVPALSVAWRVCPEVALLANAYAPIDVSGVGVQYAPVVGLMVSGAIPRIEP